MNPTVNEMKQELYELDHDCRNGDPNDSCGFCHWIFKEATDREIRERWEEAYV